MTAHPEDPLGAVGSVVEGYKLVDFIGKGKFGYVYKSTKIDIDDTLACKLIPKERLKDGWTAEVEKTAKLRGKPAVIQYHSNGPVSIRGKEFVYILTEYVDGENLANYKVSHADSINLDFIQALISQLLEVLLALESRKLRHGDLHLGNIMIAKPDPGLVRSDLNFKVGDFGIGNSINGLTPKDDYLQTALICANLMQRFLDPSELDGEDRYSYDILSQDFLAKKLPEVDPTMGDFVRNPRKLIEILDNIRKEFRDVRREEDKLRDPFDYLSCEQFGDSFELLQRLYSTNFPGYPELLQKTNTILTGPRGCGKTTIFRNLSLKARLSSKQEDLRKLEGHIGVYYHCRDLFFAFPYFRGRKIDEQVRRIICHYFNLSLLYEILETIHVAEEFPEGTLSRGSLLGIEAMLQELVPGYVQSPREKEIIRHGMSYVEKERQTVKKWTEKRNTLIADLLPLDFLWNLAKRLGDHIPWMKRLPLYFFLDDYSLPKIPESIQGTLNDIIFHRYAECFFKVATESVTSFHSYDSSEKLLEEAREYDVVDLGAYFMEAEPESRRQFLGEVINNRLDNAQGVPLDHSPVSSIMGRQDYGSYNELARRIQKGEHVYYNGWETVCDLCSGDIAHILHVTRDILADSGYSFDKGPDRIPIAVKIQDKAIRNNASHFLNNIQSAPGTGPQLRRIAEAFGNVANHYLRTRNSKNDESLPPMQASRIELQDNPEFGKESGDAELMFKDLIKYSVFIQILRGKSQRGSGVPRLHLRRLLLPRFLLTPSKRDSIRIEADEFRLLLTDPDKFEDLMKSKKPRDSVGKEQTRLV